MSHRLVLTISNDHFAWLAEVQKKKGLENIQEAIRSVLENGYSSDKGAEVIEMQRRMPLQTLDTGFNMKTVIKKAGGH